MSIPFKVIGGYASNSIAIGEWVHFYAKKIPNNHIYAYCIVYLSGVIDLTLTISLLVTETALLLSNSRTKQHFHISLEHYHYQTNDYVAIFFCINMYIIDAIIKTTKTKNVLSNVKKELKITQKLEFFSNFYFRHKYTIFGKCFCKI